MMSLRSLSRSSPAVICDIPYQPSDGIAAATAMNKTMRKALMKPNRIAMKPFPIAIRASKPSGGVRRKAATHNAGKVAAENSDQYGRQPRRRGSRTCDCREIAACRA